MKRTLQMLTATLLCMGLASFSHAQSAEPNFLLGIDPLSILTSPDIEGFEAADGSSVETIDGSYSLFPSIRAGIGIDFLLAYLDLTVGFNYLLNDAFNSVNYFSDLAFLVKIDEKGLFAVGPHAGPIFFNPSWEGDSDVDLDGATGLLAGIKFYAGGQTVKFSAAFDYLNAKFDATGQNGWVPSKSQLNISGFALQLGVLFRF